MSSTWKELLMQDHETTERVFAAMDKALAAKAGPTSGMVANLCDYLTVYVDQCHNMKEEKHLFALIEKRGIPRDGGPLAVMLGEHEQAREILSRLKPLCVAVSSGERGKLDDLAATFREYADLCRQHFWKENDILYVMATKVMSADDNATVLRGIAELEASLGPDTHARYYRIADEIIHAGELEDLSFGLERATLAAILNTLPIELSFVDAEETVRYFSHEHGEKIFGRTRGAIGTKVQNCHPQKSVHVVNQILADFKAGKRSVAEFWIDLGPRRVHIRYWAVRDAKEHYLGCLETVQDITAIQKLTGQRRLLDLPKASP